MRRCQSGVLVAVLIGATDLAAAQAAGSASETTSGDSAIAADATLPAEGREWRAELSLWAWLMGIEGTQGVRGVETDLSASFGDILDASDSIFAFSGRLELGRGKLGAFVDGLYADLGVEDVSGPLDLGDLDIEFEQVILDFGVMYRVADHRPQGPAAESARTLTVDLYGGGRYSGLELTLDPALTDSISDDHNWLDPIVGAKLVAPLNRKLFLSINGDVGGFGVESDFTWSATGLLGYDFHIGQLPASVMLGYRAIGWDYEGGSAGSEFTWDIVQHGLILGLSTRF